MIIKSPINNVAGFSLIEWVVDHEPSPKKELKSFLRERFENLTSKKVQEVDSGDEDGGDITSEFRNLLIDITYGHFSLTEDGDIMLINDDDDDYNLLLTDVDARGLLPRLKAKLEDRMAKLGKLLK